VPAEIQAAMRPYQRDGFISLLPRGNHFGGILADDMGWQLCKRSPWLAGCGMVWHGRPARSHLPGKKHTGGTPCTSSLASAQIRGDKLATRKP